VEDSKDDLPQSHRDTEVGRQATGAAKRRTPSKSGWKHDPIGVKGSCFHHDSDRVNRSARQTGRRLSPDARVAVLSVPLRLCG
jgi:hypothetical protein